MTLDRSWLDTLLADAELVADAATSMGILDERLLHSISLARQASDDASREAAYRHLQQALAPAIRALSPITLADLREQWEMHRGFRRNPRVANAFWLASVILLVFIGYMTSLYDRATEVVRTMHELQRVRLFEQGLRLYDMARQHHEALTARDTSHERAVIRDAFLQAVAEFRSAQNSISSVNAAAAEIGREVQVLARTGHGLCRAASLPARAFGADLGCIDPTLAPPAAVLLPGTADRIRAGNYGSLPPAEPSRTAASGPAGAQAPAPPAAAAPATGPPAAATAQGNMLRPGERLAAFSGLDAYFNQADLFFQDIGAGLFMTRVDQLNQIGIRDLAQHLDMLRNWVLPAAYGLLGAAIFFMRRFLDPLLPNPSLQRVTYRVLFGGFAGIAFAWLWTPLQLRNEGAPFASFASFTIAFLAGYGTDILFQVLDKLINLVTRQLRG